MVGLLKLAASSAGLPCHQFISQASMKCRRALDCWVVRPTAPIAGLHAADSTLAVHVSPALSVVHVVPCRAEVSGPLWKSAPESRKCL